MSDPDEVTCSKCKVKIKGDTLAMLRRKSKRSGVPARLAVGLVESLARVAQMCLTGPCKEVKVKRAILTLLDRATELGRRMERSERKG